MEGNRARWRGQASNLVGGVSRSRVGSTPAAFRQIQGSQQPLKAPQGASSLVVMLGVDLCNNACGNAGLLDWLMSQAYGLRHSDLNTKDFPLS